MCSILKSSINVVRFLVFVFNVVGLVSSGFWFLGEQVKAAGCMLEGFGVMLPIDF